MKTLIITLLFILYSSNVWSENVCDKGEKVRIQEEDDFRLSMECRKGEWTAKLKMKKENKRAGPGAPPCEDSPAMNNTCPADRGHCLQFTEKGAEMDRNCPGTCDSCDGCRCQDNHQWHNYCPYWQQFCASDGVLGNWMTTNCRKTCGKCKCKCCSYNGEQHALGAIIQLPEKCGQLQCVEGLVAPASPLLTGASAHAVSHPEELTLTFVSVHDGYDCCILPDTARSGEKNGTMVPEGWTGKLPRDGQTVPTTCCHGTLSVPLSNFGKPPTKTSTTTSTSRTTMKNDEQCKRSYNILNDDWRKVNYVPGGASQCNYRNCDKDNFTPAWYRFQEPAGYKLPIAPPAVLKAGDCAVCQTQASAWIEEQRDPVFGEGIIDINICNAYSIYECRWKVQGKAVACQDYAGEIFYLYYLPPMVGCNLAYCAIGA